MGPIATCKINLSDFIQQDPSVTQLIVKMNPIYHFLQNVEIKMSVFTVKLWSKSNG